MNMTFTCPYCYEEHKILECGMKCAYMIKETNSTCFRGVVKKDDWIPDEEKKQCLKCTHSRKRIFCTNIGKEIPTGFLFGKSLPIAMIGAKSTGKSNYIAVVINEIRKNLIKRFNATLDLGCSEESKKYYDEHYYSHIYKNSRAITYATNLNGAPPMIFPLRFMDSKNRVTKVATLTFYDSAGESFNRDEDVLIYDRYIPNSKGIILLLDPLQVPSVRKKLEGKMDLPPQNTETAEVLSRVVQTIRDVNNNHRKQIDIPLALAFTKMDALERFDVLPPDSSLRCESMHMERGAFVISDFENTNIEMSALLENWLDAELLQMVKNFKQYSLFGLSALGTIPAKDGSIGEVRPKRVLDPLLWLLAENSFISKVKN